MPAYYDLLFADRAKQFNNVKFAEKQAANFKFIGQRKHRANFKFTDVSAKKPPTSNF